MTEPEESVPPHEGEAHEPEAHEPEAHEPEAHEPEAHEPEQRGDAEDDTRVPLTPGLVILGLVAVALGLFAAVVMSAHSLAR